MSYVLRGRSAEPAHRRGVLPALPHVRAHSLPAGGARLLLLAQRGEGAGSVRRGGAGWHGLVPELAVDDPCGNRRGTPVFACPDGQRAADRLQPLWRVLLAVHERGW